MLKVHWVRTDEEAIAWAYAHAGGQWLSGLRHPLDNGEIIKGMKNGRFKAVAVTATMATGWRLEGVETEVTFADDFPKNEPGEPMRALRVQAEARIVPARPGFYGVKELIPRQVDEADDGGE